MMRMNILLMICWTAGMALGERRTEHTDMALQETTQKVYSNYDKNKRPPGDGPTTVGVDIYIISLSEVSEINMDFTANMYIRQRWRDSRLANSNFSNGVLLTNKIPNTWIPDTFIKNDKISKKSEVTTLNTFLRVDEFGDVLYSLRITSTIACSMRLKRYPFDKQRCNILFESYGHAASELSYYWNEENGMAVEINEKNELPEHVAGDVVQSNCTKVYNTTGAFSCIAMDIVFTRQINYYIMGLFVPSVLIVVLSWVAFWIDKSSTPGRVSLSLLTILTMTNQMSTTLTQLPRVSYIKLVDVWLTGCLTFVFAGFLEYALVNKLATEEKIRKEQYSVNQGLRNTFEHLVNADDGKDGMGDSYPNNGKEKSEMVDIDSIDTTQKGCMELSSADKVDYYSKFLFPLSFSLFNLILWSCYLIPEDEFLS